MSQTNVFIKLPKHTEQTGFVEDSDKTCMKQKYLEMTSVGLIVANDVEFSTN